jgi:N-acetylneuraminate synthase
VDSAFSLEPAEMKSLVIETGNAWQALGRPSYGPTEAEKPSLIFRRSIYIAEDAKAGDVLTPKNLRVVRPGKGLQPRYYDQLLGRKLRRDVTQGTPFAWDLIS